MVRLLHVPDNGLHDPVKFLFRDTLDGTGEDVDHDWGVGLRKTYEGRLGGAQDVFNERLVENGV